MNLAHVLFAIQSHHLDEFTCLNFSRTQIAILQNEFKKTNCRDSIAGEDILGREKFLI